MALTNLANQPMEVLTGNDSIVVTNVLETIRAGRSLDVTEFTPDVIPGGHVIIKDTVSGEYKPMPVTSTGEYDDLPTDHVYAGIQIGSVLKTRPFGAILIRGGVNPKASVYDSTPILDDLKEALTLITFNPTKGLYLYHHRRLGNIYRTDKCSLRKLEKNCNSSYQSVNTISGRSRAFYHNRRMGNVYTTSK